MFLLFHHKFISRYLGLITSFLLFSSSVFALPQDGNIRAGDVQINQTNSKRLDVNQSTDKAIIDWHSFNIAEDEHTHFQLPSSDSFNLSRVIGGQRSDIFGRLSSNGRLMLINPNGVVFGQNSQVDVHGLVATTSGIRNEDFLANRFHFSIPGKPSARIVNRGTINIGNAGLLAFVAPGVENSGIINARLGRVGLASSNQFTLDLYGDNLITLGVEGKVLEKVYDESGKPVSSLVDQSGTINADGGRVYLQTNAARDIVDHAINVSGIIEAKTAEKQRGDIILNGRNEGRVKVSGVLDASGLGSGQTGGRVRVLGDEVILEKAKIFASGFNGGGTVLVGGDYQGKGSVLNARNTYFDVDSYIYADATNNGNGGKIILWADERTDSFGKIYARGGTFGGDGGFVETSGKQILAVTQAADVSAPFGKPGEWLLDPFDIEIVDSLSNAALTGGNKVDVALINAALNNGTSVKIQSNNNGAGEGNILLSSAISKTSGGNATLTLDAAGGITINNTITSTVGALTLDLLAATGVVINEALTLNGGTVTLNSNETFSRTNFENPGRQNIFQKSHLCGATLPAEVHVSGVPSGLVHLSGNQNTTNTSAGHGTGITLTGTSITTSGGSANFEDGVTLSTSSVGVTTSGGDINFNGTLDGAQDLSLTASTGRINFNGVIGGTTGLSDLTIGSSSITTFEADSTISGNTSVNASSGMNINGKLTTSSTNTGSLNADSDADGSGIFSLGSSGELANSSILSIIAGDFDFQGTHSGNTLDLFWISLGSTFGIGDATGNAQIDNNELGRLRSFQLTDTSALFRTNGGTINIDNAQKLSNSVDFRATNINFVNGTSAFNQLVFRGENVSFQTNVSATGLVVGDQITNLSFLDNSNLTTSSVGSGGGTGDSLSITGTTLSMSSSSTIESGPGSMNLNFSEGMTLGLLSTTSSKSDAISLTTGSSGIRDADTDGSLDISSPNSGLVVSASGGFGTFENPIEFNVGSLDIPSSQDFSSNTALANQNFSTTFGQSLQTVTTTRTFRSTSETTTLITSFPIFNIGNNPIQAIGGYTPAVRPLFTNVFSRSFSLIETTTTTTTSTFTTLKSGSFGDGLVLASLNNSSLGRGLFDARPIRNSFVDSLNFGLQSLSQTISVSQSFSSSTTSFQSFGSSSSFGGQIPIGTRSLGTVRTIGGGIATCLLSPSGSVRAVNILADSNGEINNQNNFDNVGLDFTPSSRNTGFSTNTPVRSGGSTPGGNVSSPAPSTGQGISRDESSNVNANISGNGTSIPIGRPVGPTSSGSVSSPAPSTGQGISREESSNVNANISGSGTSIPIGRPVGPNSGGSVPREETPSINANISGNETSVGARISGGETSIGARISGGETPNINANISGSETSVRAGIPDDDILTIETNLFGDTPNSNDLSLGSRTNDRNLNNPDQFQGNANAEQRSLDARISGNSTPGQTRNNSVNSGNNQNLDDRMATIRRRLVGGNTNQTNSNSNANSLQNSASEQTLEQRMRSLYDRVVGKNRTFLENLEEISEN